MFVKVLYVLVLFVYVEAQSFSHHESHASSYVLHNQGYGSSGGSGLSGLESFGSSSDSSKHHYHKEHYVHPKYQFKYGDLKEQEESRDGDVVKGHYSVYEPDGTILIVHYTADKHSGFNAVVHREGHATHPQHHSHP